MNTPDDRPLPAGAHPRWTGLTEAQAADRIAAEGPNLLPGSAPRSTAAIVREVLMEPMFLMLLAAGAIYLVLGDRGEAMFLLAFVFAVIGITLVQERRTQRALDCLRDLSAPRAMVIREGRDRRIAGREVARGDVLVLQEGDRIAADAVLLEGQLSVDESLLTGEAVPVSKLPARSELEISPVPPGGDASASLFASTLVTRGIGVAKVHATAGATAVGRLGQALEATAEPLSPLQQASRRLVLNLGLGAVLLACTEVLLAWLWDARPLLESLLSGIALAMAILPEEIPVILTVFLALGAWRISRSQVLTRRVSAVEALGAITVLAVDKTGTLTQNRMAVMELATSDASFANLESARLPQAFHTMVEYAMLATPVVSFDPMENAIRDFGRRWLPNAEQLHRDQAPQFEYSLSGEMLAVTRVFSGAHPGQHQLATKGAPEAVADLCHLPGARQEEIRRQVEAMAERGLRVLAVAMGRWEAPAATTAGAMAAAWPHSQHDFDFEFLGLVGLADPPRPEVPGAVAQCRQAGVRVIMMTGDHPVTARAIARQVGLSDRPAVITGAEVDALDDMALRARLLAVDLCARMQPAHKLRLVQVLRAAGHVVAMTGDGVNDAPALKAADVGIAMGQRGSDVAREAAALVLLDDSFAPIVAAIGQGRRIFDNIGKASCFVFAVHVPIVALALVPALLDWPVLLLPVHIVLLEFLIDPACSVVFEAEPAAPDVLSRPPRPREASPFSNANLFRGTLQGLGVATILLSGYGALTAYGSGVVQARTATFIALLVDVLLLTLANRGRPRWTEAIMEPANPWLRPMAGLVAAMLASVIAVPALRRIMQLALPDTASLIAAATMLTLSVAWILVLGLLPGTRSKDTGAAGSSR